MHRASDRRAHAEWLNELEQAADRLDLDAAARSRAGEVFLADVPDDERSKRAHLAASLYVGALLANEERPQTQVADAVGVSRLTVQQRWKDAMRTVGIEPPGW